MSSVNRQMSTAYVDHWDMLNNFCFHVYAQKSLFIGENANAFLDLSTSSTLSCEWTNHRAGSQLNKNARGIEIQSKKDRDGERRRDEVNEG